MGGYRGGGCIRPVSDDGVLSLDFLAGFTIFMLALIMVLSMVPGLLAGLQSSGIDYDAVAYRTGVILAEDPGWPADPPWELCDRDHKDDIQRMGLAISKETPNILLSTKIERFFENASQDNRFFTPEDYRSKAIFGDIPYSYNFSLNISSPDGNYALKQTGDPLPPGYGYIRRVVKIKELGAAEIKGAEAFPYWTDSPEMPTQMFTVQLNFTQLLNSSISPAYRIDPRAEPVNVTITNFNVYHNSTGGDMVLRKIGFQTTGSFDMPFYYEKIDNDSYTLHIDGAPQNLTPGAEIKDNISLVLKPAATSLFPLDQSSTLNIRFTFENTNITGTHLYDYNLENVTRPNLKTGILEVAIW